MTFTRFAAYVYRIRAIRRTSGLPIKTKATVGGGAFRSFFLSRSESLGGVTTLSRCSFKLWWSLVVEICAGMKAFVALRQQNYVEAPFRAGYRGTRPRGLNAAIKMGVALLP